MADEMALVLHGGKTDCRWTCDELLHLSRADFRAFLLHEHGGNLREKEADWFRLYKGSALRSITQSDLELIARCQDKSRLSALWVTISRILSNAVDADYVCWSAHCAARLLHCAVNVNNLRTAEGVALMGQLFRGERAISTTQQKRKHEETSDENNSEDDCHPGVDVNTMIQSSIDGFESETGKRSYMYRFPTSTLRQKFRRYFPRGHSLRHIQKIGGHRLTDNVLSAKLQGYIDAFLRHLRSYVAANTDDEKQMALVGNVENGFRLTINGNCALEDKGFIKDMADYFGGYNTPQNVADAYLCLGLMEEEAKFGTEIFGVAASQSGEASTNAAVAGEAHHVATPGATQGAASDSSELTISKPAGEAVKAASGEAAAVVAA